MKDIVQLIIIIVFILMCLFTASDIFTSILEQDEYTKQLEQSLNEQLVEKEIYINILESKELQNE